MNQYSIKFPYLYKPIFALRQVRDHFGNRQTPNSKTSSSGYFSFIFPVITLVAVVFQTGCGLTIPEDVAEEVKNLQFEVDYNMHVKPILSDRCYHCHGPDEEKRSAEMRLDTREGLLGKTGSGVYPFSAGKLSRSEAIRRILSEDHEYMMPPPEARRELSDEEKAILVQWVENGAEWERHWSFIPPKKEDVPEIDFGWHAENEIDQFIHEKLVQNELQPSGEASKETLLRRLSMDLTGLPPTPEELDAFTKDSSENSYENKVDELLHSVAYAERMTLDWLDLARYADSHGFHADGARMMWPWRDWVIQAFDQNMPYDKFVTEQLAGDLLEDPGKEQVIATAFNRNHPMTAEGGVVDEEFRLEYVSNRTNTFGTAFLGLTLECAKCHDHKFDPISQKEYYQISAFFNNQKELGMTGDDGEFGPIMLLTNEEQDQKLAYLNEEIERLEKELTNVEKKQLDANSNIITKGPLFFSNFNRQINEDSIKYIYPNRNLEAGGDVAMVEGIEGLSAQFDHQYDRLQLSGLRPFEVYEPFSAASWIYPVDTAHKTKAIVGNTGNKNQLWRGWELYLDSLDHVAFRLISTLPHDYLHVRTKRPVPLKEWTNVLVTYDGSLKADGVKLYINGSTAEFDILFDRLQKSIIPVGSDHQPQDRGILIGKSRRSFTGDNGIYSGRIDNLALFDFQVPEAEVSNYFRDSKKAQAPRITLHTSAESALIKKQSQDHQKEKLRLLKEIPELMVMEEMSQPRPTFVLERGEYDKPTEQVEAGTISSILPFADSLPANRLGLSKWLFSKQHPLTARVVVNRYWQMLFGQGIVKTANDFGSQGSLPSHPELLDWLAVDFMESGWDVKRLIKKMVMSSTYRQSSVLSKEKIEKDPANILLSRGPSYRWPAEMIRDNALAASGLLETQVGGASAKPYQPEGLWIELGNFSYFLRTYQPDQDRNQYRRSMYTFIRRTSPPPNMTLFDAPNREVCTITRERTNTPLQALVLLNDPQFVEASRALAFRMHNESDGTIRGKLEHGFRLALSRSPGSGEIEAMKKLYDTEYELFKADEQETDKYLNVGQFDRGQNEIERAEFAALALVANTLLNMDEAYIKR